MQGTASLAAGKHRKLGPPLQACRTANDAECDLRILIHPKPPLSAILKLYNYFNNPQGYGQAGSF
jgi:hypothetical protein